MVVIAAEEVGLVGAAGGGVALAADEAEVVQVEAEEEVNMKNLSSFVYLFCIGGRGGGQRSGAIQEFTGTKMTFDDSD